MGISIVLIFYLSSGKIGCVWGSSRDASSSAHSLEVDGKLMLVSTADTLFHFEVTAIDVFSVAKGFLILFLALLMLLFDVNGKFMGKEAEEVFNSNVARVSIIYDIINVGNYSW